MRIARLRSPIHLVAAGLWAVAACSDAPVEAGHDVTDTAETAEADTAETPDTRPEDVSAPDDARPDLSTPDASPPDTEADAALDIASDIAVDAGPTCADLGCDLLLRDCREGDPTCGACKDGTEEVGGLCIIPDDRPTGLSATQGTDPDLVRVTWDPMAGVDGYHVYRDGVRVTSTALQLPAFVDEDAPAPPPPGPVSGLEATDDVFGQVALSWLAVVPSAAPAAVYRVSAVRDGVEGPRSPSVSGFRAAAPVRAYEVRRDGVTVATVTAMAWTDTNPTAGSIGLETPTASDDLAAGVALSVAPPTTIPGPSRAYGVRARSDIGMGDEGPDVSGRAAVGAASLTWEWAVPGSSSWSPLEGGTSPSHLDTTLAWGTARLYRAIARAEGAPAVTSIVVEGFRRPSLAEPCEQGEDCDAGQWCPEATSRRLCSPVTEGAAPMAFVHIPAGAFTIGAPTHEDGWTHDAALAEVELTRDFFIGRHEVTVAQWKALSGGINPSFQRPFDPDLPCNGDEDDCPVQAVTWWSALWFTNALSVAEGLPPCFDFNVLSCTGSGPAGTLACGETIPAGFIVGGDPLACQGYRLPAEVEWERAARGTATASSYNGPVPVEGGCTVAAGNVLKPIAVHKCSASHERPSPVSSLRANAWGLFDVLGNVSEWTLSVAHMRAAARAGVDQHFMWSAQNGAVKGGHSDSWPRHTRFSVRSEFERDARSSRLGLRVVRTVPD